jgi:hypothetical protein
LTLTTDSYVPRIREALAQARREQLRSSGVFRMELTIGIPEEHHGLTHRCGQPEKIAKVCRIDNSRTSSTG